MEWILVLLAALVGYLLGSIPVGLWVTRLYGVDIRTVGSGRTGGTNAWRAAGLKAGIPTGLGDLLKGALAVWLVRWLGGAYFHVEPTMLALAVSLAGGAAVWGHNWSFLNNFKGGAGGATAAATSLAISPLIGGIVAITFLLMIWWSRMASIATFSVGVSALAAGIVLAIAGVTPWAYVLFGIMALVAIFIALGRNRKALAEGNERVITLW